MNLNAVGLDTRQFGDHGCGCHRTCPSMTVLRSVRRG